MKNLNNPFLIKKQFCLIKTKNFMINKYMKIKYKNLTIIYQN